MSCVLCALQILARRTFLNKKFFTPRIERHERRAAKAQSNTPTTITRNWIVPVLASSTRDQNELSLTSRKNGGMSGSFEEGRMMNT